MKDVNLDTIIDTLLWYKTWQHSGYNHTHANKNFSGNAKELTKVLGADEETRKSLTLTIPLGNLVKIFLGIILRQHRTDRKLMGLLREQCAELRTGHLWYCCSPVWVTIGGRIPWNATAICATFKISCLMGRHFMSGGSEYHFKGPVIPFGFMAEYHLVSAKDQSRLHQYGAKVLPGTFFGCVLYSGGIWKEDRLVADIKELKQMDASEIYSKKTQCKGSVKAPKW